MADTRKLGIGRQPPAELYVAYNQAAPYFMNFVIRTEGDPMALVDTVRSARKKATSSAFCSGKD